MNSEAYLQIRDLQVSFSTEGGIARAVDRVSLEIPPGTTLGLVGESGCGKSVTALSILRLVPSPPGKIEAGQIIWNNRDLLKLDIAELIKIRGQEIGIIFQEPLTSFNPVQKIGRQIAEVLRIHSNLGNAEIRAKVIASLNRVGISNPERQFEAYPHELSGGMRQRAMIAMALICNPRLVIADEPTTALDVTIQAQILDLMQELQTENRMSLLMITHNLGIIAEIAQRVAVMYAGRIVETADVQLLFAEPLHPYTRGLMESIPRVTRTEKLYAIPGMIPDLLNLPSGCYYQPRCSRAMAICEHRFPELTEWGTQRQVACWLYR